MKCLSMLSKAVIVLFALLQLSSLVTGQTLPYKITNRSDFSADEIYVAVVGITDGHVWVDAETSQVKPMSLADNTVPGPVNDGNMGPGNNGLYADCFTKLSDIPNQTINIPQIAGCRILISFQSPLYLYFFGHSGDPQGYAAPNLANATDPNQGIKFELVELTFNQYGLWTNTSRVDSYQYPIGLEVWGQGFNKKVGEIKTHQEIIQRWKSTAPIEFQGCLNESEGIIHFPSKTVAFQAGGAYAGYLDNYINGIWSKYAHDELVFNSGDAGIWRGRVYGETFEFVRDRDGQRAIIARRPTTIEAMEGSGVLASGAQWDLVVQAQFCAAINRHVINLGVPSGVLQDWSAVSNYYQTQPYNWYCMFWHQKDISFEGQTYAFCYDDVFDQSATIHTPAPQRIEITLGGFSGQDNGDDELLEGAAFYESCGFSGSRVVLPVGDYRLSDLLARGILNDDVSSIEVADGYKVTAFWDDHFLGASIELTSDNACLVDMGWNDKISSVKITTNNPTGILIEAEDFTIMSGVDTEGCSEGGLNVGWIDAGDWMVWDVNIPVSGAYEVQYRVSSPNSSGVIQFEKAGGAPVYGTVTVPNTGGWQNWQTISHTVSLQAGVQQIAVYAPTGGYNINWLRLSPGLKSASFSSENALTNDFKIYPVPAEDYITVVGVDDDALIEVFSISGQKMVETRMSRVIVSNLPSGYYLLVSQVGGEKITSKFYKK